MIRPVTPHDAAAIAALYNHYVLHTTASFEEEAVPVEAMRRRIEETAARWPYLVWEEQGRVKGYCYAHPWKARPAYRHTLETTVYLDPACTGRGIGTRLMHALIGECRGRARTRWWPASRRATSRAAACTGGWGSARCPSSTKWASSTGSGWAWWTTS